MQCEKLGRMVPATNVDHVHAIRNGGQPFPHLDGLMSLCQSCHSRKTLSMEQGRGGREAAYKGAKADGLPVDMQHPFYRETFASVRKPTEGVTPLKDGPLRGKEPHGCSKFQ